VKRPQGVRRRVQSSSLKAQEGYRCSHFPQKCKSGTEAVQGVHRLVESSELVNREKS
jgi:hypothetical protein